MDGTRPPPPQATLSSFLNGNGNSKAVATARDAPKRCFICLTDQDPSDPPSSWVDPCPCTLEAHQDCMLSWVTDCERSNKPLLCPVCKSTISLEGPWDPAVVLHEAIKSRFSYASPLVLVTSVSLGIQFSMQMYGAMAMWAFSGRESLLRFLLGPKMMIDGRAAADGFRFKRVGNAAILMNVAPALLIGQLFPSLGNKIFVPSASVYGIYHVMHDDRFFSWPPSPELAIAVFPYIRSIYYNLWREFVYPYEAKLNRQILGLPPSDGRQTGDRGNRRQAERAAGEWGMMGYLQNLLDALEPEDDEHFHLEDHNGLDDDDGEHNHPHPLQQRNVVFEFHIGGGNDFPEEADNMAAEAGAADAAREAALREAGLEVGVGAPALNNVDAAAGNDHEVPQAPPANRPGLGSILHNVSDSIVSAMLLPGISFAMGEALRLLILPRSWTTMPNKPMGGRPGLLQQQWGRSLVGGCIFAVLRDAIRLYTRHRMVATMGNRRVKNVDRRRKKK